jgi:hypothetical protein
VPDPAMTVAILGTCTILPSIIIMVHITLSRTPKTEPGSLPCRKGAM